MRKIDYTKIPCTTFLSCVAFIPFCTSRTKLFYLNLHDFAIKIIYNTKLLICNVFWSIFRYVFQAMKSVALISSKLQKCGSTGCCKTCWQIRIIKIINQNGNIKVLSTFNPVLSILCRGIKKRARNEKIYKTNSRLQFNSDSLNNNIWEFLQKGAKNWVQHFFRKNVSARVLHDFRDLKFVTRFIVSILL